MRKLILALALTAGVTTTYAQSVEELKKEQAEKTAQAKALQSEADAIQATLDGMPGWRKGAFGTIGGSVSGFNNWYAQGSPNNSSGSIGITGNAFANLKEDTFFWRNAAAVNLNWVKLDDKDNPNDNEGFKAASDVFTVTSLYGRNVADNWAVSALGEYRTTIINNFNDPGYLDLGIGATWTPITDLVVVMHPLNYNFVFSNDDTIFDSSLGAKIVADYTRKIGAIGFKTNLSLFQSYKSADLSNWTWTNSFGYTLWKKIGVGFDFGLRNNKQEALNYAVNTLGNATTTFDTVDNKIQSYWLLGLNYSL